ncbi:MAG: alcohol dehydrogenase family protein [Thiohalocapsa sp.]|nr:alcohol dehydrogenase family protein [Thiohalocapsa sp.]MCF7991500.1 alcohol dehydrogenase family protein [Thiohalocapsa sp.]
MTNRFDITGDRPTMQAVVTTGNGGYDKLELRDVPVPAIGPGEALLQVLGAGVNNTEINTRVGWYSSAVSGATADSATAQGISETVSADGGWNDPTPFPFIQGTDCCGRVVDVAPDVGRDLMHRRVLVRACMRRRGFESMETLWLGSDFDGAFAQFVRVPAAEVFPVECDWSDAELATIPCAYGTAENMLQRAAVGADDHVLVTGASGGVGSAAVQLAKRRGARVTAIAGGHKIEQVLAVGADRVIARGDDPVQLLGKEAVDIVVDNVAGATFGDMLALLRRGGRYVSSGAIAGPLVTLDMRDFYLKDLTMIGCTAWDERVFPDLVSYLERGELRPLLAKVFPLSRIADAQREFLDKRHVGKFVLVPPPAALPGEPIA